jgi:hypothetical protein
LELCTQAENTRRIHNHPEIPKWGDWEYADIVIDPATGCHVFPITQQDGYARFWIRGRLVSAHGFYYRRSGRKVPKGMELDHLCRNRACVNVDHLEPVTRIENLKRGAAARRAAAPVQLLKPPVPMLPAA